MSEFNPLAMRWPWQKKLELGHKEPPLEDYDLPQLGSIAECLKCGVAIPAGSIPDYHPSGNRLGQEVCCHSASIVIPEDERGYASTYYAEHLSQQCPSCRFRWPERTLDWKVSK